MQQKTVDLRHVQILVLDEADRMLDMGFIRDIRRILAVLPKRRQNLLFSATFSDEIRELAEGLLHDPAQVQVARRNADSELVAQRVHPVAQSHKRALLAHLVRSGDWHQVLVFTRTKHGANRLAEQLCKDGVEATAIHGNKSQGARTKALAGFKDGSVRVLVATDLASRGLDIEELPHVVNYELPHVPEDYVHRIGRTGRAGSTGEAISLVSPEEHGLLADIEKLLKRKLVREGVPGFEPGAATASQTPPARREQSGRRPQEGQQRRNHAPADAQRGRSNAHAAPRHAPQMRPIGAGHAAAPARAAAPTHAPAPARPAAPAHAAAPAHPAALARPTTPTRSEPHVPALLRGTTRRAG
jgi:ATP-dependent RNA helicase RhlE